MDERQSFQLLEWGAREAAQVIEWRMIDMAVAGWEMTFRAVNSSTGTAKAKGSIILPNWSEWIICIYWLNIWYLVYFYRKNWNNQKKLLSKLFVIFVSAYVQFKFGNINWIKVISKQIFRDNKYMRSIEGCFGFDFHSTVIPVTLQLSN